jgi:orotidine-5'-phosphate decarboxylase
VRIGDPVSILSGMDTEREDPVTSASTPPPIAVALDVPTLDEAVELAAELKGLVAVCKVGLELFSSHGPEGVARIAEHAPVFLDLKLHDIPNTVAGAVRTAARLGARLLTVHASGGEAMLRAAAEAAGEAAERDDPRLRLLAVTVLTSLDDAGLAAVAGPGVRVEETVGRLAGLARESGIDGAVSSVNECRAIKLACGEEFLVVTPGIRLAGQGAQDQKRVATPGTARAAGADFLVVGRTITAADDPVAALSAVRAALEA